MENKRNMSFDVRAVELHSSYAWDYNWIMMTMDFMVKAEMNTLILHRNDFVDLIIYPGRYFGYDGEASDTIFETYSQIFRKLYKYTPTRRSGPYQRRAFLKRVLAEAKRRSIDVYIQNKELFFPDIILEFYPELVQNGHICASHPFWQEFLQIKYRDFFREFPEISGIITAPATGESRVSIKSNRCQCSRCQSTKKEEWFDHILRAMYQPIHAAGKKLVVRDFVFDPEAHKEIAGVMAQLPEDVIISLKNTPHDYYPTFPNNSRIGQVGQHPQWVEFDAMGQYFGWGIAIADLTEDYRQRMEYAKAHGVEGIIIRTDWESLDGHTAFGTPNRINLYAGSMLAADLTIPDEQIYMHFLETEGWFPENRKGNERKEAMMWFRRIMGKTWEAVSHMLFIQGCVISDSSLMPVSYEHGFWLAEEKNSIKDWDISKRDVLLPEKKQLEVNLAEKELAVKQIAALKQAGSNPPEGLCKVKTTWLQERLHLFELYGGVYKTAVNCLLLSQYLKETKEDRETGYYDEKQRQWQSEMKALQKWEKTLRTLGEETDYTPHTIYTLLDPDRVSCLFHKLLEKAEQGGGK